MNYNECKLLDKKIDILNTQMVSLNKHLFDIFYWSGYMTRKGCTQGSADSCREICMTILELANLIIKLKEE